MSIDNPTDASMYPPAGTRQSASQRQRSRPWTDDREPIGRRSTIKVASRTTGSRIAMEPMSANRFARSLVNSTSPEPNSSQSPVTVQTTISMPTARAIMAATAPTTMNSSPTADRHQRYTSLRAS